MPSISFQGLHVAYESWGSGRAVAMLHSGGSSSAQWTRVAAALSPTRWVIAPDFLGFGGTDAWPVAGGLTHDLQAALVAEVLGAESASPADIVGHSYGGGAAVRLALRHPERVRSLVLIEPIISALLAESGDPLHAQATSVGIAFITAVDAGQPERGWERFIDSRNGAGTWASLSESRKARFLAQSHQTREGFISNRNNRTTLAECRSIRVPTTILCSGNAIAEDRRVTEIAHAAIPGSRYVELADAGHMSPLTHPEPVARIIDEHLAWVG